MSVAAWAVVLENPKIDWNVGSVQRACAAYDVPELIWSGTRVWEPELGGRLPREERMRGYQSVRLRRVEHLELLLVLRTAPTLVAVELLPGSQPLTTFEHPTDAVYVFGPEDGDLSKSIRSLSHRFVHIPTRHCINLGQAVSTVLYDRLAKEQAAGRADVLPMEEMLHG